MTVILKAKPIVEKCKSELAKAVEQLKSRGITPNMKVILVGDFAPSVIYTRNKKKYLESLGADCEIIKLEKNSSYSELESLISKLNTENSVHGILLQLPLPGDLNKESEKLIDLISQNKDVDGLSVENQLSIYRAKAHDSYHLPCTPKGILTLLEHYNIELEGKEVVIIGRGQLVGRPLSALMTGKNATVTLCHSKTKNLHEQTKRADIIVLAAGVKNLITKEHLGENKPVIIDVGINKDESTGKLTGDCDYKALSEKCSAITPVPGGVGPMTILSLAQNLIEAANKEQ